METTAQQIRIHVQEELNKVMFGLEASMDIISVGIIAGGNLLISGQPGSGKTLLSKSLMRLLGQEAARIDCGNDIEFVNILHSLTGVSKNHPAEPDKTLFYLAGLNRLTPNTQAILLPVMEEHQLINNNQVVKLSKDFRIVATFDPYCYEDTFPLLAALRDRFYISLTLDYLTPAHELEMLKAYDYPLAGHEEDLQPIVTPLAQELITQARAEAKTVSLTDPMYDYVIRMTQSLRHHPDLHSGVSQRASLSIINAAKIHASLNERDYVNPDDIQAVAPSCLAHRICLTSDALISDRQTTDIVQQVLTQTELPGHATD